MKKHSLKIWISLLAVCALFLAVNAIIGKFTAASAATKPNYCDAAYVSAKGEANEYNDPALDTEQVMVKYHTRINQEFNKYIGDMLKYETIAADTNNPNPRGNPPKPVSEGSQTLEACPADNYSTYCVGMNLLNNEAWGYVAYRRALDCRRGKIFETKVESAKPVKQGAAALQISARLEAITREKTAAKRALDQTLSAYNELRTAWLMHRKYMAIYKNLIKYRDKMVEIRKQVEEFPSKFIDASTTKCT